MFILIKFVRTNVQTVVQTNNKLQTQLVENTKNIKYKDAPVRTVVQTENEISS